MAGNMFRGFKHLQPKLLMLCDIRRHMNMKVMRYSTQNIPGASLQLPIIDLSLSSKSPEYLGQQIVDAFQNTGFLFVENVPNLNYDRLYECNQWFFTQPEKIKKSVLRQPWNPNNQNVYRGFFPVEPGESNRFEGFDFAKDVTPGSVSSDNWFYEPSVWPEENGNFPFKDLLLGFYDIMHYTALEILRLCAVNLELPENYFDYMFADKPMSTFRLLHYPTFIKNPPNKAKIDGEKILAIEDHVDSEYLTLLTTFGYSGLEILSHDGKWMEIVPRPNSLVVNIGETFSRMTGNRFKSTRHRVIDLGIERYSAAFFMTPAFEVDIGFDIMKKAKGEVENHKIQKFGPFHLRKMKYENNYTEFKDLPDITE